MGRGGAGAAARISAKLSRTPELLAKELNGLLPEGVTETDTEFIFDENIHLNKKGLKAMGGKIYSDNPFETMFDDPLGKEMNDAYYRKYKERVPAMAFTFDPETKQLTLDGWRVEVWEETGNLRRWSEHAEQISKYGEQPDYDYHVKGWYNKDRNSIGIAIDRHFPHKKSRMYRSREIDINTFNMAFDTLETFAKYIPRSSKVVLGEWVRTERRVKLGSVDLRGSYTEYELSDFVRKVGVKAEKRIKLLTYF